MLVLSRRVEQGVCIGPGVTVRVLGVRAGQVSLGFIAPKDVRIHREEVYRLVVQQNERAALGSAATLAALAGLWQEGSVATGC